MIYFIGKAVRRNTAGMVTACWNEIIYFAGNAGRREEVLGIVTACWEKIFGGSSVKYP